MLGDRIGNFKVFLAIMVLLSGLSSLALLFVPPSRIRHSLPEDLPLLLKCSAEGTNVEILPPFSCNHIPDNDHVSINVKNCRRKCAQFEDFLEEGWILKVDNYSQDPSLNKSLFNYNIDGKNFDGIELNTEIDVLSNVYVVVNSSIEHKMSVENSICENQDFPNNSPSQRSNVSCWVECESSVKRSNLCSNVDSLEEIDPTKTLIYYSLAQLLLRVPANLVGPLIGGATIAILKQHGGDFGFQNIYMNIGMVVFTPISGKLIDIFSSGSNQVNFGPPVYIYIGMQILCSILIMFIDLEFKQPAEEVFKNLKKLLSQFEVVAFIFINFIAGACFGFLETFLFWLLEDLGADKGIMGITITVGAAAGIPVLLFSTPIIKKMGHVNTLVFALFIFVFRFIGYTFIGNPWMAMPFEFLECFTLALFGVAASSYISELATPYTVVTLQGISSSIHWGIGKGAGSLLGGILSDKYGLNAGFRIMALICGLSSAAYFAVNWFIFRPNLNKKKICGK